jgi:predicted DNA-binding protein with PD1-like motif
MASATRRQSEAEVNHVKHWKERFEIVSLVGTFAQDGSKHLHLSISDSSGNAFGGHLIDAKVFTTVELVLGTAEEIVFDRVMDPETGYRELTISSGTTTP